MDSKIFKNMALIFITVIILFSIIILFNIYYPFTKENNDMQLLQVVTIKEGMKIKKMFKGLAKDAFKFSPVGLDEALAKDATTLLTSNKSGNNKEQQQLNKEQKNINTEQQQLNTQQENISYEEQQLHIDQNLDKIFKIEMEKIATEKVISGSLADDFCNSMQGSSVELEKACNTLTNENCNQTNCCVLVNGKKCSAGGQNGPTFQTDLNGNAIPVDFYYYQNKRCSQGKCV